MDNESSAAFGVLRVVPRLFPSLGPALLLAVGYIDPGKWAATVDGGARFGFDLVLPALAFNCSAILCQYLAARIGVVTGKNLAQIYKEEYNRPICIMLGVQAELSAIILELTMIVGIAYCLNLLFGMDLFMGVFLTAVDAVLFPLFIVLLDKFRTDVLFLSISGFALLFYMLGILISQPEIPLAVNVIFPRLRGESAYSLMSLLGASIMPHNFYLHSSIVQRQQEELDVSIGSLCHDHFFALVFTFNGIFLVNYVVIVSAATIFHNAGLAVLTFQDSLLLMDQMFQSPVAPLVLFLVLFFSSQVTALTWNLGGQVLLHDFFGIHLPVWIHRITVKALAIIPALYCVLNSGPEGIYQLLIFSQILLAMLLPSSVIPLFRVASSGSIMGAFKISWFMEILAFAAFLGMVAANLIFIIEMLFGDSDWVSNVMWNMGSSMTPQYILVLLTAFASVTLMLWLAATPLKSASDRPDIRRWDWDVCQISSRPSEPGEENDPLSNPLMRQSQKEDHVAEEEALEKSVVSHPGSTVTVCDHNLSETIVESDCEPLQPIFEGSCPTGGTSLTSLSDESTSAGDVTSVATLDEVSSSHLLDAPSTLQVDESKNLTRKAIKVDNVHSAVKDDDEVEVWEVEESTAEISGKAPSAMSEGSGSFKCGSGRHDDGGGGSGSLSRSSGLGRAARRLLASILDEFWGQLYDYHGHLTQEAKAKRMDDLLGLDLKQPSSVKADSTGMEYVAKYLSEAERRSAFAGNPKDFDSLRQQRILSSLETYGVKLPSSSSALPSYNQLLNAYAQSSGSNVVDPNERQYFSLRLPSHSDVRVHQPATIHGYQRGPYLSQIAADRSLASLNCPLDPSTPRSPSLVPRCRDSLSYSTGQNVLSSLYTSRLQNPAASLIGRLPAERHYYDPSSDVSSSVAGVSTFSKKYHSSPDISDLVGVIRNSSLMGNAQLNNPTGLGSFVGGKPYEQLPYLPARSRTERVPLAFDELSTSTLYRDPFSLQTNSSLDSNSLWSRQPFEQLFGIGSKPESGRHGGMMQEMVHISNPETQLLQSFRTCIFRLLKLEGSDWLFRQSSGSSGFDEKLIDCLAVHESYLYEAASREANLKFASLCGNDEDDLAKFLASSVPNCGVGCVWQGSLIVSFGVWCIRRILELSVIESRPEHWGKYTYVLNRLQGIIDSAFFRPRSPNFPCSCLQMTTTVKRSGLHPNGFSLSPGKLGRPQLTTATAVLELIKDVEIAVAGRKGKTGTAAGDVAFPKGKENLASVLKRYKRRLSNKSGGTHEGGPSGPRKGPVSAVSFAL